MKKECFVNMINAVMEMDKKEREFEDALEPFFDGYIISNITGKFQNDIIVALEHEMGDKNDTISWWLWDAPDAGNDKEASYIEIIKTKEIIRLDTIEQLYDYFSQYCKNE